jgi:hypothetical protein
MNSRKAYKLIKIYGSALLGFVLLLASGCAPGNSDLTPTVNPTLVAVEQMLTQTSAAPTTTATSTATFTPTATQVTSTPVVGSTEQPASAAERIAAGVVELVILTAQPVDAAGDRKPGEAQILLDFDVQILNASTADDAAYTPSHFTLFGRQRSEYAPLNQAVEPRLRSGNLHAGEFVRGHVTFEIPEDEDALYLRYNASSGETWIDLRGGLAGPGAASSQPAVDASGLPRPGERVEAAAVALEVNQVLVRERLPLVRPPDGWVFLELLVSINNIDRDNMPYNPDYFRIKDLRGYEYGPATNALPDDSLNAGALRRNDRVIGRVLFAVPAEAVRPGSELVVSYLPSVLFDEFAYEEIRVLITPGN